MGVFSVLMRAPALQDSVVLFEVAREGDYVYVWGELVGEAAGAPQIQVILSHVGLVEPVGSAWSTRTDPAGSAK